ERGRAHFDLVDLAALVNRGELDDTIAAQEPAHVPSLATLRRTRGRARGRFRDEEPYGRFGRHPERASFEPCALTRSEEPEAVSTVPLDVPRADAGGRRGRPRRAIVVRDVDALGIVEQDAVALGIELHTARAPVRLGRAAHRATIWVARGSVTGEKGRPGRL